MRQQERQGAVGPAPDVEADRDPLELGTGAAEPLALDRICLAARLGGADLRRGRDHCDDQSEHSASRAPEGARCPGWTGSEHVRLQSGDRAFESPVEVREAVSPGFSSPSRGSSAAGESFGGGGLEETSAFGGDDEGALRQRDLDRLAARRAVGERGLDDDRGEVGAERRTDGSRRRRRARGRGRGARRRARPRRPAAAGRRPPPRRRHRRRSRAGSRPSAPPRARPCRARVARRRRGFAWRSAWSRRRASPGSQAATTAPAAAPRGSNHPARSRRSACLRAQWSSSETLPGRRPPRWSSAADSSAPARERGDHAGQVVDVGQAVADEEHAARRGRYFGARRRQRRRRHQQRGDPDAAGGAHGPILAGPPTGPNASKDRGTLFPAAAERRRVQAIRFPEPARCGHTPGVSSEVPSCVSARFRSRASWR